MRRGMALRYFGIVLLASAACGDNSDQCGPGTINLDNVCVPAAAVCGRGTVLDMMTGSCIPDPTICGAGTLFDVTTNACELDPDSCKGGTIPINGSCQDPTAGLTVDVEEGPEPNGFGVLEA